MRQQIGPAVAGTERGRGMTEDDVLEQLDADWGADAFDVQPIDSHYRAADNRLTVFRSDARWVLLFEQVVYNVGEDAFERRLFAHGNALDAEGEGEWRCGVWDGRPFAFDPEVTALDPIARTPRPDRARFWRVCASSLAPSRAGT